VPLRINVKIAGLALIVAAAPTTVFAQADADTAAATQRRLVDAIESVRTKYGPLAVELVEPFDALALFYDANGDEALAIATTDQAMQIVRANYGLYSLEQIPMLNRLIGYAEERGEHSLAWILEQDLQEIARRNWEDLRSVPVIRNIADRRIDMLERYVNGEFPPQVILGCYYAPADMLASPGCTAGRRGVAAAAILEEAQSHYKQAIDTLVMHGLYQSPELRASEMDLVRTSYLYGRYLYDRYDHGRSRRQDDFACGRAIESLTRLHSYDELSNEPLAVQAESLIRVADYQLYCGWNAAALNRYRAALGMLAEAGVPQARIDRLFAPERPIDLPAFAKSALDVQASDTVTAFAEVAFELTRFGVAQNVRFISGDDRPGADAVENRIRRGRFRPFANEGEIVDSPRLIVRYFLDSPP